MIQKVFAIYDTKAQYYGRPFHMRSKGEAIRMFTDASNDKETEIGKHPEDFCLFYLADFNQEAGTFLNVKAPESLGMAQEFVKVVNDEKVNP